MADSTFRVRVEHDHLRRLANATPIQAVAELVWNALDADATRVDVGVDVGDLGMRSISVKDNGHGFTREEAEERFGKVGGSWKRHGVRSKTIGRILHGKEGKGRFRALGLGRIAEWNIRFLQDDRLMSFRMTLTRDDLVHVHITEAKEVEASLGTGVEVMVNELDGQFRSLETERAVPDLSSVFAVYLTNYREPEVYFERQRLEPEVNITDRTTLTLSPINTDGEEFPVAVELIQWNSSPERSVFLCGEHGFPFARIAPKFQTTGHVFSAYLKSRYVDRLQERGAIDLAEMDPAMAECYEEAADAIQAHLGQASAATALKEPLINLPGLKKAFVNGTKILMYS